VLNSVMLGREGAVWWAITGALLGRSPALNSGVVRRIIKRKKSLRETWLLAWRLLSGVLFV
jgi:hypothetical protein